MPPKPRKPVAGMPADVEEPAAKKTKVKASVKEETPPSKKSTAAASSLSASPSSVGADANDVNSEWLARVARAISKITQYFPDITTAMPPEIEARAGQASGHKAIMGYAPAHNDVDV